MVNSNVNALGVIFANTYDNLVPELVAERSMASIPFGGRYRLIDFTLSSMANAGIDNVSVIVRKNYHSLMDHLGAGREWDLTRKRGGLNIVPPVAERSVKLYSGRVDALDSILNWLEAQKERYVILSDSYIAMNFDFGNLIDAHVASGADVTMVYNRAPIPEGARSDNYTIRIAGRDVKNTSAQVSTALSFAPSEYGVTFTLNGGEALPGVVQVEMTGDNAVYTRVYLHNALKGKWQFLNIYKDHVLEADTAGEYLLTTQNLRFVHVDFTFFIAGLVVIVGIIIAYIAIKKRYWFW
mgnify:CR=1 FL=1